MGRVNDRHGPSWKWWVCGVVLLATMLNYMDRQALPQLTTEIQAKYNIDNAQYGMLEKYFSRGFALGSLFFGLLADRFGPRLIYPVVLFGWSMAGLLTPFMSWPSVTDHFAFGKNPDSGPFYWLLGCRTLLGIFESGHWPCALITARQVLMAKDRTLGNGILQSGAMVGTVLIITYTGAIIEFEGSWQIVFWSVGLLGLFWIPLWFKLIKPGDLTGVTPPAATESVTSIWSVSFLRMYLTLGVVVASLAVSFQFLRAWTPKYLLESLKFTNQQQVAISITCYIFADLGSLLSGILVRKLAGWGTGVHVSRLIAFVIFAGITGLAALIPLVGDRYISVVFLIVAFLGILGLHPIYYALVQELPSRRMGLLSGPLSSIAWLTTAEVQGTLGEHIKETKSYDAGLIVAGLVPFIGLIVLLLLWKPSRNRTVETT